MNSDLIIELTLSAFAGAAIGLIYLGGLWFTVRGLEPSGNPVLRLLVSAALRLGLILAATFLAIAAGADGGHIIAAFMGFLAIRQILIMRVRSKLGPISQPKTT
jgi:F1F0 ATPase subunit 2